MGLLDFLFGNDDAEEQRRREERAAAAERAAQERQFRNSVESSEESAIEEAMKYFSNRGLDPAQYESDITTGARSRRSGVPHLAGNVGSYFSGLGGDVYGDLTDALRTRNLTPFDQFAPTGFAESMIPNTADDEIIAQLIAEGRAGAEGFTKNLLDRGVVTERGYGAAQENLGAQESRIRGLLQDLGSGILKGGRADLENVASRGRLGASTSTLGGTFDPNAYKSQIDAAFADFTSGLGDRFRSQAPKTLFETAGLPAIAGQAQGAQNLPFSAKALSGQVEEDEEEENRRGGLNIF